MGRRLRRAGLGLALAMALMGGQPANTQAAQPPGGWQAEQVKPVGYLKLPGDHLFKLGIRQAHGRWYLFVANGGIGTDPDQTGFYVVDVTSPDAPRLVTFVAVPESGGQITLHGDLLVVGRQLPFPNLRDPDTFNSPFAGRSAPKTAIVSLFNVSRPDRPVKISDWIAEGWGTHRNAYAGGRFAFLSARLAGFGGQTVLSLLDVSDPRAPREAGRWWWPGQKDGEPPPSTRAGLHGGAHLSADGRTLTAGYAPGFINLDISDPARPRLLGRLELSPLSPQWMQAVHTAAPIGGGFFHLSSEPFRPGCGAEHAPLAAIVDNRDPARPMLVAHYPRPRPPPGAAYRSFCAKDGRFGPHNVNVSYREADAQPPNGLVYMTYFNAGLRIYDVTDPYEPAEVGWFLPQIGLFRSGFRGFEDVLVDTRGFAYLSDGRGQGVWVLRYAGPAPGARNGAAPAHQGRR